MIYCKDKEQILAAIIARLKSLPAGARECSAGLFHDVFPEEPFPEFKELFDLNYSLRIQAEKAGLAVWLRPTTFRSVGMLLYTSVSAILDIFVCLRRTNGDRTCETLYAGGNTF